MDREHMLPQDSESIDRRNKRFWPLVGASALLITLGWTGNADYQRDNNGPTQPYPAPGSTLGPDFDIRPDALKPPEDPVITIDNVDQIPKRKVVIETSKPASTESLGPDFDIRPDETNPHASN